MNFAKYAIKSKLILALSASLVFGCSTHPYKDRSTDYVNAQLKNYDLSGIKLEEDLMPISGGEIAPFSGKENYFQAPRPQPLAITKKIEDIQIRQLGERKWIWLNWQVAQIWTEIYDFLDEQKLKILRVDAKNGTISTQTSLGVLNISLRQGVVNSTSELYLNKDAKSETQVTEKYRQEILKFLQKKQSNSVSLVGLNLEKNQGAELFTQKEVYLLMDFSLDRTQLELDSVLNKSFNQETRKLTDKNFSKGEFYIRYVSKLQDLEKSKESDFEYTLKLTKNGADKTKIQLLNRKLGKVEKPIAEEILRFVQRQFQ